jgi:hypothetical protein
MHRLSLLAAAVLLACSSTSEKRAHDSMQDGIPGLDRAVADLTLDATSQREIDLSSDVRDEADVPLTVSTGADEDERTPRELASSYQLPDAFYQALEFMSLDLERLFMPDIGLTADWDMSRLHWTDTIRHQGHRAPTFGYMVIDDVEAAVELPAEDIARALLIAEHTYNERDQFVDSRYDEMITLTLGPNVLLDVLAEFTLMDPEVSATEWEKQRAKITPAVALIPGPVKASLALAIEGLLGAARLRDEALLGNELQTLADWEAQHKKIIKGAYPYDATFLNGSHPGFDFEAMNRAGQLAMRSVESLRTDLMGIPAIPGATFELSGPLGRIVIDLSDSDNTWKYPDLFLLVDLAGNDSYIGRVASNTAITQPVSALLDLAGDDTYAPATNWEVNADTLTGLRLPMQGAGIFGVGILVDGAGNDHYGCLTHGQGSAIYGVGVLVDHAGSDVYQGYDFSQGSAEFGYGLLLDLSDGDDSYETLQHSQGYGGPRGMGWIVDQGGNDQYLAIADPIIFDWANEGTNFSGSQGFAFGWRGGPYWSGGLGGLFDLAGDDAYQCAVMCMGFGYFFGTGLFYDRQGDDNYVNTHKYTLGSATHQSVGLFIDGQGEDSYTMTGDDEAIGLGYDHGVAYHIDRGDEDDVYTVENIGHFTLGFARHPGLGTLINEGGNDAYHIPGDGDRTCGLSWVDADDRKGLLAEIITLALFLDLGGNDDYDIARDGVENNAAWHQTDPLGAAWDPALDFAYGLDEESLPRQ